MSKTSLLPPFGNTSPTMNSRSAGTLKSAFGLVLAVLTVVDGQAIKDPTMQNPVVVSSRAQLIASLEQSTVRIGDPLRLRFRLKNVSSGVLDLVLADFNDNCWLMVTDASGSELPRTAKGDKWRRLSAFQTASVLYALSPKEDDGNRVVDVAELYRLDRPGNYFVRIVRRIGADSRDPRLPSQDPKVLAQIPVEEAFSDLIPFMIVP